MTLAKEILVRNDNSKQIASPFLSTNLVNIFDNQNLNDCFWISLFRFYGLMALTELLFISAIRFRKEGAPHFLRIIVRCDVKNDLPL